MSKEDSILIDYFKYTSIYQSKYGPNTIVFMQVGAFFEVYSLKHPKNGTYEITKIVEFTETCNLNIAEKKMTVGTAGFEKDYFPFPPIEESMKEVTVTKMISQWLRSIPECKVVMAGVRDYQIEKYIQKMTENGFTVVLFIQEKTERGTIQRKLYNIYSPGTFLGYEDEGSSAALSNHIMAIWVEKVTKKSFLVGDDRFKENLICGVSCLNIFTGESHMFEYETPYFMNPTTFDELERTIATLYPKELIIISTDLDREALETVLKYIGISSSVAVHFLVLGNGEDRIENCTKQTYIRHVLGNVFGAVDILDTCSEFTENAVATQSFCFLLDFIREHNPDLLKKVHVPIFTNVSNRVILANHTLKQLNIIHDNTVEGRGAGSLGSVSSFLNKCCTTMGRRKFQYQITHPVFDSTWLEGEYSHIEHVIGEFDADRVNDLRRDLRTGVRDVEKMLRQLVMGRIYPSGLVALYETVNHIVNIHDSYGMGKGASWLALYCGGAEVVEKAREFLDFLVQRIQIDKCKGISSMSVFEENFICPGVSLELDACVTKKELIGRIIEEVRLKLGQAIIEGGGELVEKGGRFRPTEAADFIRIHETEKSGISFQTTKKRSAILKAMVKKYGSECVVEIGEDVRICWKDLQITTASASYDEIEFDYLSRKTRELHSMGERINGLISDVYMGILKEIEDSWYRPIENLGSYIARLDVLVCKAYLAMEYRYCRPRLDVGGDEEDKAYVAAEGLRHCLIEHLQRNEIYVTNDLSLGREMDGVLLYGTNAVGKTSVIRALGIAVIMAQSGCFVPCSSFVYRPYRSIYSRILGNDNIFKGLSTFAVEMSELRMILKMADADSLILGDELCSGTELDSALSIFMAGLMDLSQKGASFIFATHFHEILDFAEMKELVRVAVKHMSVVYDHEQECLVYDRKIRDGPGNRMYGLEVCKSLFLPHTFLEKAYEIRGKYFAGVRGELGCSVSHYNARKIMGVCEVCGVSMGEEMHHLQWQKDADADGFIGHFHKNHPANLVSVCSKCHDGFHHGDGAGQVEKDKKMVKKKTTKGYRLTIK
jgi:DNA mismatch repair protein MutS